MSAGARLAQLIPVVRDGDDGPEVDPFRGSGPCDLHDPYALRGPNPAQERFHRSDAKFRLVVGGLGSGKSTAVAREAFFMAVLRLGKIRHIGLVVSETYRHLADNTLPAFRRAFDPQCLRGGSWETAFSRTDMVLTLAWGTEIAFRVTGNRRFEMLRGPEYAWACFDEGRNIPNAEPWNVIIGRIRFPGVPSGLLRAWGGTTPNGHDWQHETWVARGTPLHEWFHAPTAENAENLPEGYETGLRTVYSDEDAQQELDGLFITRSGAVYSGLAETQWPDGNLMPWCLDPRLPAWLEVDFGYRNPRCHVVQRVEIPGLGEQGAPLLVDVIAWEWQDRKGGPIRDATVPEMIAAVKALGLRELLGIYCDPAGDSANDQTHLTSVQQLRSALAPVFYPTRAWQRSVSSGEQVVRGIIRAADGTRRLTWAARPSRGGGYEIRPEVRHSFAAVRALQYPPRVPGKPQPERSDKDGLSDHDTDAIRYRAVLVHGRPPAAGSLTLGENEPRSETLHGSG